MNGQAKTLVALCVLALSPTTGAGEAPRSGYSYLGEELRALQDDPFANPGQLWVDRGSDLWSAPTGSGASCADCHDTAASLEGVAARMPRWDDRIGGLENLEMQINACRTGHQNAPPLPWESEDLLALTTLVSSASQGMALDPDVSGPAAAAFDAGQREYTRRRGQLDLSCAHCHEENAGRRLRGDVISDGMINGFPIYRLTWQTLGSRQRMFRWCNEAVVAEPHAYGSDEYLALELYLAWRGRGLLIETPAVRR